MTNAILTLDGIPPLEGTVETGGDYVRFSTNGNLPQDQLDRLHKGRIEIDGRTESVMVKSVVPQHATPGTGKDQEGGLEVTLQRYQPSAT